MIWLCHCHKCICLYIVRTLYSYHRSLSLCSTFLSHGIINPNLPEHNNTHMGRKTFENPLSRFPISSLQRNEEQSLCHVGGMKYPCNTRPVPPGKHYPLRSDMSGPANIFTGCLILTQDSRTKATLIERAGVYYRGYSYIYLQYLLCTAFFNRGPTFVTIEP